MGLWHEAEVIDSCTTCLRWAGGQVLEQWDGVLAVKGAQESSVPGRQVVVVQGEARKLQPTASVCKMGCVRGPVFLWQCGPDDFLHCLELAVALGHALPAWSLCSTC